MNISNETITEKRSRAGRKGGLTTLGRYGRDAMRGWGKLGGRPRSLTLSDIKSGQISRQSKEDERSERLPTGTIRRQLRELLIDLTGGAVVCGNAGSPERSVL